MKVALVAFRGEAMCFMHVKEKGLVAAVCKACAAKMEALEAAQAQGLPIGAEMSGHPSLAPYIEAGYQILTF